MLRFALVLAGYLLAACAQNPGSLGSTPAVQSQPFNWSHYGGDAASTKYAPMARLDSANIADLRVVWRWQLDPPDAPEEEDDNRGRRDQFQGPNRSTPIAIDGVLYTSTPQGVVVALDGASGQEMWRFAPAAPRRRARFSQLHRGVAYWSDGQQSRLLFGAPTFHLYALDAGTGRPDSSFGDNGRIDLIKGLSRPADRSHYGLVSPPIVVGDVVIAGSSIHDWRDSSPPEFMPPGDVQAFDVRTGAHLWTFNTVPQGDEYGTDTWENESWKNFGAANMWSFFSADAELGYVYLPLSTPTHDFYGGERPGDNLFGESLVCLEAQTGQRVWHFQAIHHGLWDYDFPAAPILLDVVVDGRPIKAVALLSKQAFCYVLDRVTGQPVWPIVERPVPPSAIKSERPSPTQPFPTKPAPYDHQGLAAEDLIDFTPELYQAALEIIAAYEIGPLYTPPTTRGTVTLPGLIGGSDWVGGSADPHRGVVYVPSHTIANVLGVSPSLDLDSFSLVNGWVRDNLEGPEGLPLTKPPYGRLTAIDINTGDFRWVVPLGRGPVDHPALRHLDLPDLGWPTRHFVLATANLVLIAPEHPTEHYLRGGDYFIDPERVLRAYNPNDGRVLADIPLPANASANPMAYTAGDRDYLVVPMGGDEVPAQLAALAIPRPGERLPPQGLARGDADHPTFYRAVKSLDAGDLAALDQLLKEQADLIGARGWLDKNYEHSYFRGATLLHHIAGEPARARLADNVVDIAHLLLDRGAPIDARTLEGLSTLDLVVEADQPRWNGVQKELIDLLIENGADPLGEDGETLWNALVGNIFRRRGEDDASTDRRALFDQLARAASDRLPLRWAVCLDDTARLATYFAATGQLEVADDALYRPGEHRPDSAQELLDEALHLAVFAGASHSVDFLLGKGAAINSRPRDVLRERDDGSSVFHKAVIARNTDMVRQLLARGGDPTLPDRQRGSTALRWAQYFGSPEMIALLEQAEAEVAGTP